MKGRIALVGFVLLLFSVATLGQAQNGTPFVTEDFFIQIPRGWDSEKPAQGLVCDLEGPTRNDGSYPSLTIGALVNMPNDDDQLIDILARSYSANFQNVTIAQKGKIMYNNLRCVRMALTGTLRGNAYHIEAYGLRACTQNKVYLVQWMDRKDHYLNSNSDASSAINSFRVLR